MPKLSRVGDGSVTTMVARAADAAAGGDFFVVEVAETEEFIGDCCVGGEDEKRTRFVGDTTGAPGRC